ncbi:MAG: class III cytochrome C family protein, partial [Magnetococcales bacterium]|nr:class III cytochrome C family protein [Magnetococcales bacterium]
CHSDHAGIAKYRVSGRFSHQLLQETTRSQCTTCHRRPDDPFHRQASQQCTQCHGMDKWKPATFNHEKYFSFDRDHNVKCAVCHPGEDYKKYTCYGCHEHSVAKVRKKHVKEGINDYERCVLCHRNADEHAAKDLWRSGRWRDGLSGVPAHLQEGDSGFSGQSYGGRDDEKRRGHKKHKDHDDDD